MGLVIWKGLWSLVSFFVCVMISLMKFRSPESLTAFFSEMRDSGFQVQASGAIPVAVPSHTAKQLSMNV